jgi:type IV pilus assembly protein PilP
MTNSPEPRVYSVFRISLIATAALLMSACGHDMSDLNAHIDEIKARPAAGIDPIPQMKPYEPFAYSRRDSRSPFEPFARDEPTNLANNQVIANTLRPDTARNREPLEEFPLDGIRLLGTLEIRQTTFALLSAPDGIVHRASYGDHLGQNFGKIVQISDAEIQLEEIVPDGFGGYVKRPAIVAISEEAD